jgi:uncharacterized repeat protein (TIGR03803 family)
MNPKMRARLLGRVLFSLAVVSSLVSAASAEWKEKVLYGFQGGPNDGFVPAGGVVFDKQGDLYGATTGGGPSTCAPFGSECGTVFQLSPPAQKGGSWTETLIYQFQGKGSNDGSVPNGGLIIDAAGNLYGVTAYGGTGYCLLLGSNAGCGTVYEISPPQQQGGAWTETLLYSFATAKEGYLAIGNLVFDDAGNLYGATWFGGDKGTTCDSLYGGQCGVVYELSPPKTKGGKWTEKVLHSFAGGTDGAQPNGGLVLDGKGAIYGTTQLGGNQNDICHEGGGFDGCGTVFVLSHPAGQRADWSEKVLYRFKGRPSDGSGPQGGPVLDGRGDLYGTTIGGGSHEDGVVFKLARPAQKGDRWTESLIHVFTGADDGQGPWAGLLQGPNGSFYGTASGTPSRGGLIFRMKPPASSLEVAWTFDILYDFTGSPDGYDPLEISFGKGGVIFGVTLYGGTGQSCQGGCGTVFRAAP